MKLFLLLKLACSELTVVDPNIINGNHPDLADCPVNSCYSIFNDVCEVDPKCFHLGQGFPNFELQNVSGGENLSFLKFVRLNGNPNVDCHDDGVDIRFKTDLLFKDPKTFTGQKDVPLKKLYFTQVEGNYKYFWNRPKVRC